LPTIVPAVGALILVVSYVIRREVAEQDLEQKINDNVFYQ
jgi:hypothetical protein